MSASYVQSTTYSFNSRREYAKMDHECDDHQSAINAPPVRFCGLSVADLCDVLIIWHTSWENIITNGGRGVAVDLSLMMIVDIIASHLISIFRALFTLPSLL